MSPLEQLTSAEPIIGWRAWRVRRIETLRDGKRYRLCAVGTNGLPPVWPPRHPVQAVCSESNTDHEAPHPDHPCGLYAMRSRARVERLLAGWKNTQNGAEAWALGRVTLTGRVVEFELGWRGEYAYPYALTVFSDDPAIAVELRRSYAVDVDEAPGLVPDNPDEGGEEHPAHNPHADIDAATVRALARLNHGFPYGYRFAREVLAAIPKQDRPQTIQSLTQSLSRGEKRLLITSQFGEGRWSGVKMWALSINGADQERADRERELADRRRRTAERRRERAAGQSRVQS